MCNKKVASRIICWNDKDIIRNKEKVKTLLCVKNQSLLRTISSSIGSKRFEEQNYDRTITYRAISRATSSLRVYRGSEQTSGKIIFKKIEFANRVTLSLRDEPTIKLYYSRCVSISHLSYLRITNSQAGIIPWNRWIILSRSFHIRHDVSSAHKWR